MTFSLRGIMRTLKILPVALTLVLGAIPLPAAGQQQITLAQVVDKIVAQEQAEGQSLRQYSAIVATCIQILRTTRAGGAVPTGAKYFPGCADLTKGEETPARARRPLPKNTRR